MSVDRERLRSRIEALAAIGGRGTAVTRLGLSRDEQAAHDLVSSWLTARGGGARRDAAANRYVRFGGDGSVVLVGSHADSVPEGGRFDGALGVCCAVEAVESLLDDGVRFRRPVEVVAWCDEEGARFGIGLFGSLAAFGRLPERAAERRDRDGVTIADALRAIGERGDPTAARRDDVAAYLELHIEQGPRLEQRGLPLAVVSEIVGIFHGRVTLRGRQDHAGATIMGARKDTLAAASEMILAVERIATALPDTVGTVGEIAVRPGAKNVVPGECTFSLDVRSRRDEDLDRALRDLRAEIRRIGDARGVTSAIDVLAHIPVAPLDASVRDLLLRTCGGVTGADVPLLFSGAGHDAQNPQLSGIPTGMIFVRSTGGSHTPTELASLDDAVLGTRALADAIRELAA